MPARDPHLSEYNSFLAPYAGAETVVPSDSVDLATVSRALYVGGAGDVTVITDLGQTVTFKAVPVGGSKNELATPARAGLSG